MLDHGRLVLDGEPGDAIRTFREHLHGTLANVAEAAPDGDGAGVIGNVAIHHAHDAEPPPPAARGAGRHRRRRRPGRSRSPSPCCASRSPIAPAPDCSRVDTDALGQPLPPISAPRQLHIAIKGVWLLDGEYPVSLHLADRVTGRVLDWREAVATFEVVNEGRAEGTVALDVTIA